MRVKGFGWVRDTPDQRDFMFSAPPELLESLPAKVDLRGCFPPCYNQGALGSCTANAISGALQFLEAKEGEGAPVMPSRLFIYYNERALEDSVGSDSGAQIRDGIKTVVKDGFCPEAIWPYEIARFTERPPARCYESALGERVSEYLRLPPVLPQLLGCLAAGYAFVFGFSVYESFESARVRDTGAVPLPARGEVLVGGHAVVAAGYSLADNRFLVRNSWGTGWGMDGYFTLPFDYLTSAALAADFWTIRKVPIR